MTAGTVRVLNARHGFVKSDDGAFVFIPAALLRSPAGRQLQAGDRVVIETIDTERGPRATSIERVTSVTI